jgi:hypothetical protein
MDNLVEELQDIYNQLQSFVDEANGNSAIKSLEKLETSANEVSKSWSGSWLGYQSRIYYKDFIAVPAGAHFSSEWGTYQNIMQDTRGDWVEYQFEYVGNYIKTNAGNPDVKQAIGVAKTGQDLFEEKYNELLSIFETYLLQRKDLFIESLAEKVKASKIFSDSDFIETIRPQQIMTRDSLAGSQCLWTPPHLSIIAKIYGIRNPIYCCENLAKYAKIAVFHIERQEKEIRRMDRVGTNIFIGHGRSLLWKDLNDFIQDRLRLPWDEFNRVPIAGKTNVSRLSEMLDNAVIAFLVMTAEDEQPDGKLRARMNVVHEAGLF